MWSDRYFYLSIYKDEQLSSDADTDTLRKFLLLIPELEKVNDFEFKNKDGFPFTQLSILKAKSLDNWNGRDVDTKKTNLITIVCSKGEHIDFDKIIKVFIKIASFLNWTLINEETDDGIENFIIWKPDEK